MTNSSLTESDSSNCLGAMEVVCIAHQLLRCELPLVLHARTVPLCRVCCTANAPHCPCRLWERCTTHKVCLCNTKHADFMSGPRATCVQCMDLLDMPRDGVEHPHVRNGKHCPCEYCQVEHAKCTMIALVESECTCPAGRRRRAAIRKLAVKEGKEEVVPEEVRAVCAKLGLPPTDVVRRVLCAVIHNQCYPDPIDWKDGTIHEPMYRGMVNASGKPIRCCGDVESNPGPVDFMDGLKELAQLVWQCSMVQWFVRTTVVVFQWCLLVGMAYLWVMSNFRSTTDMQAQELEAWAELRSFRNITFHEFTRMEKQMDNWFERMHRIHTANEVTLVQIEKARLALTTEIQKYESVATNTTWWTHVGTISGALYAAAEQGAGDVSAWIARPSRWQGVSFTPVTLWMMCLACVILGAVFRGFLYRTVVALATNVRRWWVRWVNYRVQYKDNVDAWMYLRTEKTNATFSTLVNADYHMFKSQPDDLMSQCAQCWVAACHTLNQDISTPMPVKTTPLRHKCPFDAKVYETPRLMFQYMHWLESSRPEGSASRPKKYGIEGGSTCTAVSEAPAVEVGADVEAVEEAATDDQPEDETDAESKRKRGHQQTRGIKHDDNEFIRTETQESDSRRKPQGNYGFSGDSGVLDTSRATSSIVAYPMIRTLAQQQAVTEQERRLFRRDMQRWVNHVLQHYEQELDDLAFYYTPHGLTVLDLTSEVQRFWGEHHVGHPVAPWIQELSDWAVAQLTAAYDRVRAKGDSKTIDAEGEQQRRRANKKRAARMAKLAQETAQRMAGYKDLPTHAENGSNTVLYHADGEPYVFMPKNEAEKKAQDTTAATGAANEVRQTAEQPHTVVEAVSAPVATAAPSAAGAATQVVGSVVAPVVELKQPSPVVEPVSVPAAGVSDPATVELLKVVVEQNNRIAEALVVLAAASQPNSGTVTAPNVREKKKKNNPIAATQVGNSAQTEEHTTVDAESAVLNRRAFPMLDVVVLLTNPRGKKYQGYLRNVSGGVGECIAVGTARHEYSGPGDADLIDGTLKPGDEVTLLRPTGEYGKFPIVEYITTSVDEVWYRLKGCDWDVPSWGIASMEQVEKLIASEKSISVQSMVYDADVWHVMCGELVTSTNADSIGYKMSTTFGYCRALIVLSNGMAFAGHYKARGAMGCPAGSCIRAPPQMKWRAAPVIPWDKAFYGKLAQGSPALKQLPSSKVGYNEVKKTWPLRTDRGNMAGVRTAHTMMRPSTEMNRDEIQKFAEQGKGDGLSFYHEAAFVATVAHDAGVVRPFVEPDIHRFQQVVEQLAELPKSAGASGPGTHAQYVVAVGEGNMQQGKQLLAEAVYTMYEILCERDTLAYPQHEMWAYDLMEKSGVWMVIGKTDGYKAKKMNIGRTIQSPTFELKVLWLVLFEESDKLWNSRMSTGAAAWNFTGHDLDLPVSDARKDIYLAAHAALSFDMTAFDRRVPAWMIQKYFQYMERCNPGVPTKVLDFLTQVTTHSVLELTNGERYLKTQGNPSGFMNTLRLNCFVSLFSWVLVLREFQGWQALNGVQLYRKMHAHYHIEVCGDDTRVWFKQAPPEHCVDRLLGIWTQYLPWEVKLEGYAEFNGEDNMWKLLKAPPMVSRRLLPCRLGQRFYLFEPLNDASRTIKKLVHDTNRTPELEEEMVRSAAENLALLWYQVRIGAVVSPSVQAVDRIFLQEWHDHMLKKVAQIWSFWIPFVKPL